ncbi:MAG: hypothetical protein JWM21_3305 [Acidobacteria bacterium]|nr:hypothetical protein [Acidobacteriota bacterium]
MSELDLKARREELERRLAECEARFRREALKRGFDPTQIENMALPATLANLFADCEAIRSELEQAATQQPTGEP